MFTKSMEYIVVIVVCEQRSIYSVIEFDEFQNLLVRGSMSSTHSSRQVYQKVPKLEEETHQLLKFPSEWEDLEDDASWWIVDFSKETFMLVAFLERFLITSLVSIFDHSLSRRDSSYTPLTREKTPIAGDWTSRIRNLNFVGRRPLFQEEAAVNLGSGSSLWVVFLYQVSAKILNIRENFLLRTSPKEKGVTTNFCGWWKADLK